MGAVVQVFPSDDGVSYCILVRAGGLTQSVPFVQADVVVCVEVALVAGVVTILPCTHLTLNFGVLCRGA